MPLSRTSGFTLIEIMIVISILGILLMWVGVPYSHYSDRARVRTTAEQVEQLVTLARMYAVNGYTSGSGAQSMYIAYSSGASSISLRTYTGSTYTPSTSDKTVDKVDFPRGIYIQQVQVAGTAVGTGTLVVQSPYGRESIYTDTVSAGTGIVVSIGYVGTSTDTLRRRDIQILLR